MHLQEVGVIIAVIVCAFIAFALLLRVGFRGDSTATSSIDVAVPEYSTYYTNFGDMVVEHIINVDLSTRCALRVTLPQDVVWTNIYNAALLSRTNLNLTPSSNPNEKNVYWVLGYELPLSEAQANTVIRNIVRIINHQTIARPKPTPNR